jgi:transposase
VFKVRRRFDPDFRAGAVRIVKESGRPIAEVAQELGTNAGTLANWAARDREVNDPAPGGLGVDEQAS